MQQLVARNRLAAGAIEIFENIGLFLGEPDLLLVRGQKQLHGRTKLIRPDLEDGILALLMTAQMGPYAGQQDRELEGLGHIIIGAGFKAEDLVGIGILTGQHDNRGGNPVLAHESAGFATVHVRQINIQKDEIRPLVAGNRHASARCFRGQGAKLLVKGELLGQGFTKVFIIFDDQDGFLRVHALIMPISFHKAIPAGWQFLPGSICWSVEECRVAPWLAAGPEIAWLSESPRVRTNLRGGGGEVDACAHRVLDVPRRPPHLRLDFSHGMASQPEWQPRIDDRYRTRSARSFGSHEGVKQA